ncbi:MAG: MFS transporter [Chloroflexi bacterium]|nr:MFS transporter [Chloroflexota bacterium]
MVASTKSIRTRYYGWVIVFASLVAMAVTVGTLHSFGVFFKPLLAEFGWTRATTAGIFSLSNVIQGVAAIAVGLVSNRIGPRKLVMLSAVLLGLSYALGSWAMALWQLYIYFGLLQGVGRGIPYNPLMATIARWFATRRGLAMGVALSGGGVGTILFPMLGERLIEDFGWRNAFLTFGILSGVSVLGISLLLKARPPETTAADCEAEHDAAPTRCDAAQAEVETPLRSILSSHAFWLVAVASFVSNLSIAVVFVHLVAYATDLKISAAIAASFVSVTGLFNIVGKIGMGAFADRYGLRWGMTICFGLGAAVLFWLSAASAVWMFYLFAVLFGVAYAGWMPLFPVLVGRIFGVGSMSAVLGFLTAANMTGGAVGAYVAGYIFDSTHSYQLAFIMAGLALVVAIPCQLLVKGPAVLPAIPEVRLTQETR